MSKVYDLKLSDEFFNDVALGYKTFEIRKEDDKVFNIGDELVLHRYSDSWGYVYKDGDFLVETDEKGSDYVTVTVVYKTNYAQKDGYVVLGISL